MIRLQNVTKTYSSTGQTVKALENINLDIERGRFIVLRGPSGSGKTTLLMAIAGMLKPGSGEVLFENRDIYELNTHKRADFRAKNIGFVFQSFHLVPYLNVLENVLLAGTTSNNDSQPRAIELLEQLGMTNRISHKPSALSSGQKQRTAIARAMLNKPKLILADEPTGNLDPDNAAAVLGYLSQYHKQGGTIILVAHDDEAERLGDHIIYMEDGRIKNQG
jgi:ABC-type lipoprotein export system ATPase subunit